MVEEKINGVVVSPKEIYQLLLEVKDSVTILNQRFEALEEVKDDCEKYKDYCDKRKNYCEETFNTLYDRITTTQNDVSGIKARVTISWVILTLIISYMLT